MKLKFEDRVKIDTAKLGAEPSEIWHGTVIGEATVEMPVIGRSLIVLLDDPLPNGARAIAVFETWLERVNTFTVGQTVRINDPHSKKYHGELATVLDPNYKHGLFPVLVQLHGDGRALGYYHNELEPV